MTPHNEFISGKMFKNGRKFRCHAHCYLDDVTPERCPDPRLAKCSAMDPSTFNCKICGCSWWAHQISWIRWFENYGIQERTHAYWVWTNKSRGDGRESRDKATSTGKP